MLYDDTKYQNKYQKLNTEDIFYMKYQIPILSDK